MQAQAVKKILARLLTGTTLYCFLALAVVQLLFSITASLHQLVEKYDDIHFLSARLTGAELEINDLRMQLNTVGIIAQRNLIDAKDLIQEVKNGRKRKATGKEKTHGANGYQDRQGFEKNRQEGAP